MRVQPVSAIATRISASISFSTWATPCSPARGERIGPGPAQQDEIGAEREHPHDVETRADAAIDQDRHAPADRVGDRRQGARGRQHAVELASAMVGDDDRRRRRCRRLAGIVGIEDAFDDQRALPIARAPIRRPSS